MLKSATNTTERHHPFMCCRSTRQVLADAITGERMHVLDPRLGGWAARMYGWAAEELAGQRLPASPEQLEEEERDNAYDKAGFLSFMEFGGFDLRQDGY